MSLRSIVLLGCGVLAACDGAISGLADDQVMEFTGEPKAGRLLLGGRPEIAYVELDGELLLEGDMSLPPGMIVPLEQQVMDEEGQQAQPLVGIPKQNRWPYGRIPYVFDANVSSWMKLRILAAMQMWEASTPVRFVERELADVDFVLIRTWGKNFSHSAIGVHGGRQLTELQTNLSAGTTEGLTAHELGHTLGLMHEQTRVDRDETVTVHWENIKEGFGGNFAKYQDGVIFGAYNIGSIMHYGSYTFSANGKPTITRRDGTTFHENFNAPTGRDIAGVIRMYDREPPQVHLDVPTGDTAPNPFTFQAIATDDYKVAKVELLVDGAVVATKTTRPYAATWSHGGRHAFAARAIDAAGKVTETAPVTFLVDCATGH